MVEITRDRVGHRYGLRPYLETGSVEAASLGCFNLHASLLPAYRGASPIETALASGESETGVTLMRVVPRMDAGPIIDVETVPVSEEDTGVTLRGKIAFACVPLMERNLDALFEGRCLEKPQDETKATYCRKLTKNDGLMDFRVPARLLAHRIQAFRSWPGVSFPFGGLRIRVGKSSVEDLSLEPGQVARRRENSPLAPGKELWSFTNFKNQEEECCLRGFSQGV